VSVRRTAVVLVPLAVLALTACEKPAPQVTVATGGRVVNVDASRYCFESDDCKDHGAGVATLPVRAGDQVSINVPSHVAHEGWYIRLNGRPIPGFETPRKKLHGTLPLPGALGREVVLEIVQGDAGGEPQGIWKLTLAPRD
jgi:hypothetical protein